MKLKLQSIVSKRQLTELYERAITTGVDGLEIGIALAVVPTAPIDCRTWGAICGGSKERVGLEGHNLRLRKWADRSLLITS